MKKEIYIGLIVTAIIVIFAVYFAPKLGYETSIDNSKMLSGEAKYSIISHEITYFDSAKGFLANPTQKGNYPGVIMIHEWWGLNNNIKDMAKELAAQGYIVLAVDLYNGEVAATPERARKLTSTLNQTKALENMKAAIAYLKKEDANKIASLGWCFGGGQSLQLSLSQQIDATVIYYGRLVTDKENLSSIKSSVLGIFGDKDTSIPVSSVNEFDSSLDALGIQNEIYIYEGVGHAFANPSGANYAPEETKSAWNKTLVFLEKNLK